MYNVTQNFLNVIKQNGREFKGSITVRDTVFDDSNIVEIDLEENVNPTDSFMIGGVGSSQLTITLANVLDSLILENAKVSGNLGLLVNGAYENVPLGKFTVDDIDKGTDSNNTVKLTCYDNMILLEQAYFSDLSYPADINDVANEICTKAGVTLASTLPHIQINKIDGYTYREAVGFIASFLGGFARFNRDGNLEITSYVDSGLSIDKNDYTSSFTRNENNFTIGKLTCKVGDNIVSVGSNGNEIQFENPIMTQNQLNSIYATLKNLSYMPFSTDWRGDQAVQAGDQITITDLKGNTFSTLVMNNKLTYKGGLSGNISATGKTQTGQNFSSSGSTNNAVDRLVTEQANIKVLLADKATIEDLTATNANIETLFVDNASISNLVATKANITDLNATNAMIQNLQANKANISDLTASNARISTLEADAESVNNLLAGNLSASNFQAGAIQAGSSVIATGAIGDAQIGSVSAGKITSGTVDTTKVTIAGANSRLIISGNRLQVFATQADNSLYERVSLGDVNGDGSDYGLRVRGTDGITILLDENGVKREGITDGSINNAKIGSDANISGTKLDINSVVTAINGGTTTIQSSKVFLNNSTLDVQFSNLSTTVTSQGQSISNQSAQITANTSAISAKLDTQTFSTYQNTVNGQISSINNQLSTQSSSISVLQNQISTKVSSTDVNTTLTNNNLILSFNNSTGITAIGNDLTKSTTGYSWNNGITSTQSVTNGQYVECVIGQNTAGATSCFMLGLSTRYTYVNNKYSNINFALYVNDTPQGLFIFENGIQIGGNLGAWNYGDIIRVAIENNIVNYYHNGVLIYISKQTPTLPLVLDCTIASNGTVMQNVHFGSMLSGLSTRISTAESSISQLNSSISLKVDTSTFSSYQTTVNGQISSINSTLSSQSSSISVLQNQITTKVTQTDITNSINNLQIGGRNLLLNSDLSNGMSNWVGATPAITIDSSTNYLGHQTAKFPGSTSYANMCESIESKLKPNTTYVLSCYAKYQNVPSNVNVFGLYTEGDVVQYSTLPGGTVDWKKYTCTFTTPTTFSKGYLNTGWYFSTGANTGVVWVTMFKLEEGNKATDWTPAPEDVQSQIDTQTSEITQLSNSITSKVDVNGVISTIQQNPSSVQIAFNKINSAMCTFDSTGFHVKNGIIDSSTFYGKYSSGNVSMRIANDGVEFYDDSNVGNFGTNLNHGNDLGGLKVQANPGGPGTALILSVPQINGTIWLGSDNYEGLLNGHLGSSIHSWQDSNGIGTLNLSADTIMLSATNKIMFTNDATFNKIEALTIVCPDGGHISTSVLTNPIFFDCGDVVRKSDNKYLPWASGIRGLDFEWETSGSYIQVDTDIWGAYGINVWASDISLKENIQDSSEDALSTINNIKHRMFNWKNGGYLQRLGYVAQELNEVNPDFVMKVTQSDGYVRMQPDETRIIPYMTKAIQEEDSKVEELKNRITTLENIVSEQQAQIKDLKAS